MRLRVFSIHQQVGGNEQSAAISSPAYFFARVTAEEHNAPVASLSLYDNPHISYRGTATMLLGDLKLPVNNMQTCLALFQQAEAETRKAGKQTLLGPMNGSTWQEYRLPLQGEEPMFPGDNPLPAAWGTVFQKAGYQRADTYHSALAAIDVDDEPYIPKDIGIRPITPESLTKDLHALYPLCMEAFAQAPYFSPVSEGAFLARYEAARPLLKDGLSNIAFHDGRAVAFTLAYADMLHPERKAVVAKTLARHPEACVPGLIKSVADTLYYTARSKGYTKAIHALMHDANRSVHRSEEFGGSLLRSYALFAKSLHADG